MKRIASIIVVIAATLTLGSCASMNTQERSAGTGAVVGAGLGAILGQAIGGNTEGTLLGAGIGAVLGGIAGDQVGAYMDRQERDLRRAMDESNEAARRAHNAEAALVNRTHDVLTATFRSEVLFDFDSTTLKAGAYPELARVARVLNRYPDTSILVEGHTDTKGAEAYNQALSSARARAVKDALVREGVNPQRIRTEGYGESRPVSSNDAVNRRVTIVIEPIAKG